jgi:PPOX class probable F420-dependent enzyme
MTGPTPSRPYMPGYGIVGPDQGSGLLPWSWAEERLAAARNYWIATVRPDGRPHVMPVWAVWHEASLWFSSSLGSRKIRNLRANPYCAATTEDAADPVVLEGTAEVVTDLDRIATFLARSNAKYEVDYGIDFLDPAVNATVRIRPHWAFALKHDDFSGSPTRWAFPPPAAGRVVDSVNREH